MNTNPNQRVITVVSAKDKNRKETFGIITRKAERIAARILDDGTASYILYIHFALHRDGHTFAFSPAALKNELGISPDRSRTAFKKLVASGYLTCNEHSNRYTFYQLPPQYENIMFNDGADTDMLVDTDMSVYTDTPADSDISVDEDRYTCVQVERDGCPQGEGIPADTDRNSILYNNNNTVNNTVDDNDNISICPEDKDDTYGRFINGWNDETQEPNITYYLGYVPNHISRNISGIPRAYYMTEQEIKECEEAEEYFEQYLTDEEAEGISETEIDDCDMPF